MKTTTTISHYDIERRVNVFCTSTCTEVLVANFFGMARYLQSTWMEVNKVLLDFFARSIFNGLPKAEGLKPTVG